MKLQRVTITGADDSVTPMDLAKLSRRYPWVEWGILIMPGRGFQPRWPSVRWIHALQDIAELEGMQLSLHLCGGYVRDAMIGQLSVPNDFMRGFKRLQLNTHGERYLYDYSDMHAMLATDLQGKQVIFQVDGRDGGNHLHAMWSMDHDGELDCVPLFDLSHGAGVVPSSWPGPMGLDVFNGYAGGLGPDNLAAQLQLVDRAAGSPTRTWVDMETKVRTPDGKQFDLYRVEQCLTIAQPWVQP